MNQLFELLHREDVVEIQQRLNHGININDMGLRFGPNTIPRIPKGTFFQHSFVASTKQHRYSYMPSHTHNFVELNYQYSGTSHQHLDGQSFTLTAGHLLVMDREIIQNYGYMGKDDLLVNILLDIDQLPTNFLTEISNAKYFSRFLYTAQATEINHENFLIYDLSQQVPATQLWETLMLYLLTQAQPYATRGLLMEAAISCLPKPLFTNLHTLKTTVDPIYQVIHYIDEHYDSVTLDELSHRFSYNKNYLSNKIKSYTNSSFGELLNRKRLLIAEGLLLDTTLPISTISAKIGYKNPSSLFRLFTPSFNMTPTQFRRQHAGEHN